MANFFVKNIFDQFFDKIIDRNEDIYLDFLSVIESSADNYIFINKTESNLYDGEIEFIIFEILKKSTATIEENSRRHHVITDIIECNKIETERPSLIQQVKSTFKTYKRMDKTTKNKIKKIGFSFINDSNHYKLLFKDDNRYQVIISKTSSDRRAGRNIISTIIRKIF